VIEPKETTEIEYPGEMGFRLPHDVAERISKQKIMLRTMDWMPLGGRLIVVKDPVPKQIGRIILHPDQRNMNSMGSGWIIAAGPEAGRIPLAPISNMRVENPQDLLGLHIMFGVASGKIMRFSVFDSEYESEIICVSPVDVWAVDMNPAGAEIVKECEDMFAATAAGLEDAAREEEAAAARKIEEDRTASIAAQEDAAREGDERAAAIITGQEGSDD